MKLWAKLLLFFRGSVYRQLTRVMDGENDNKQFCYLGANMVYVPSSILYQLILTDGWTNYSPEPKQHRISCILSVYSNLCVLMYYGCTVQSAVHQWLNHLSWRVRKNVLSTSVINRIWIPDATTDHCCCPHRRLWNSSLGREQQMSLRKV